MKKVIAILIATIVLGMFIMSVAQGAKIIANGATSQSISVVIFDADGDPNTTPATIANLSLYCQIDGVGAQSTELELIALASTETAWTTGRAIHTGNGLYRIDIPDANLSDGIGTMLTYIITDANSHNRTAYYEVQLNPPVDVNTVLGEAPGDYDAIMDANDNVIAAIAAAQTDLDTITDTGVVALDPNGLYFATHDEAQTIVADTNELQTNQGAWATATGFSTHSAEEVWEDPNASDASGVLTAILEATPSKTATKDTVEWILAWLKAWINSKR